MPQYDIYIFGAQLCRNKITPRYLFEHLGNSSEGSLGNRGAFGQQALANFKKHQAPSLNSLNC